MAKTFLVFAWFLLLSNASCLINSGVKPPLPSDSALEDLYNKHKSDLDKLVAMLQEDIKTLEYETGSRYLGFSKYCLEKNNCSTKLPEARVREYKEILANFPDYEFLSISQSRSKEPKITFTIADSLSDACFVDCSCSKGLIYSPEKQITDRSLDWTSCNSLMSPKGDGGQTRHRALDSNWYLYLQGVNNSQFR